MFFFFLITLSISLILVGLNLFISFKDLMDREKSSPFECGFDPKSFSRSPFSLHFYLIALIFLVFDVEITMIIPMPILMSVVSFSMWINLVLLFIFILLIGTIYEWIDGSLDWVK